MATTLEYLQSIVATAVQAQQALERGDHDATLDLLGSIRDDLDAAEKQVTEKL
jgi:hypothetical protein